MPDKDRPPKAAIFARAKPRFPLDDLALIESEILALKEWSLAHGYAIHGIYKEAGVSTADKQRPEFERLLSDALQSPPPFDVILMTRCSAMQRDASRFMAIERKLRDNGVKVVATQQPSVSLEGERLVEFIGALNRYSSVEMGKSVRRAMLENSRQGFFNGSRPRLGIQSKLRPRRVNTGTSGFCESSRRKRQTFAESSNSRRVKG